MSEKLTILVPRRLSDEVQARLERDYVPVFNVDDHVFSKAELIEKCQHVDGVVPCHSEIFNAEVITALPDRLKAISTHSVGVDHIDLKAAKEKGIIVTNTPDVLSDATAEIAMLCMLAAARRASEGDRMMRAGEWDFWSPAFMVGVQVTGKRFGIIGMGRVGQIAAERARGFGMEVHYHNRTRLEESLEKGAIFHDTIDDLLIHADVLSLHCPTTPDTTGFMTAQKFNLLPDNAIFVNTARGALVDENALISALKSGKLFAAGLDVYCNEPGGNPELSSLDNVFMLPHIGSATKDTRIAMGFRAIDNLDAIFAGREPKDRVA